MKMLSGPAGFSLICWIFALLCSLLMLPGVEAFAFALSVIFLSFSFLGATAAGARAGRIELPRSKLLLIGFLFSALALASVAWSDLKFESYLYFWFLFALPLSALVFLFNPDKEIFSKAGLAASGLIIVLLAVAALAQYRFFPELLYYGRVQRPMDDPNSLAAVLSFGVFGFLGWMLAARKRIYSNLALVLCLVCFAALLTTGSRGAFMALGAGIALFLILARGAAARHWRCLTILVLGAAAVFALISLTAPMAQTAPSSLLIDTLSGSRPGLWTRPYIWASTWEMTKDHFWLGTGIGSFPFYYPEYRIAGDFRSSGAHAHNDALQFWAEMGVATPVLLYGFVIAGIVRTARALGRAGVDNRKRVMMAMPFCALGAMLMQAHVTSLFHVLTVLILAGAALALWMQETERDPIVIDPERIPFPLTAIKLAGFLGFLALFCGFAASEILVQRARGAALAGEMGVYAESVNRAGRAAFGMNAKPYLMAASVPLGIVESAVEDFFEGDKNILLAQAETLLIRARASNPRIAEIPYMEAKIAMLQKHDTDALYFLREAVRIDPLYLDARRALSAALAERKEPDEAYKVLKAGLVWPYKDSAALASYYRDVAALAAMQGDRETQARAESLAQRSKGR